MKVLLSWLNDFFDVAITADQVAQILTHNGIEVASVKQRAVPDGVVVARVLTREKHPNADRLSLCTVDPGTGAALAIVCGAPNVAAGMTVALATQGTRLLDGTVIKKSKIRGIESNGMLCSESELGFSDNHDGIISLEADWTLGAPLKSYFPDDATIEVEITPNRGDCQSILGIAREVAASLGVSLKKVGRVSAIPVSAEKIDQTVLVTVDDSAACPRYMGRLVRGVAIAPSPQWMQQRLAAVGLRPINNVVDVTNYILHQYGQPMHAFDYRSIRGNAIVVRRAGSLQSYSTLDNIPRSLMPHDLLICDAQGPVALAGIMGGAGSEIKPSTNDVFLEAAFFDPATIRVTAKRLGMSTDSSYRFERGVDPGAGLEEALDTAAALIAECAGGQIAQGRIDVRSAALIQRTVSVRPDRVRKVLGAQIDDAAIEKHLKAIGCGVTREGNALSCTVPLFRHDLGIEVDMIEEVGRLHGYDEIVVADHAQVSLTSSAENSGKLIHSFRTALARSGCNEVVTNTLMSEKWRELLTPDQPALPLQNPLNPDMAIMRTTMLGSLLGVAASNINHRNFDLRIFEIGKVFFPTTSQLPDERTMLAILFEGNFQPAAWNSSSMPNTFFTLRGCVEAFAAQCNLGTLCCDRISGNHPWYSEERASVTIGQNIVGTIGRVKSDLMLSFDCKSMIYYAELDITRLTAITLPAPAYSAIPRFPSVNRDFCFVMDEKIMAATVAAEISRCSLLVEQVNPFDVYRGEKLGANLKSIAFSISLRSADQTLTEIDAEGVSRNIIEMMKAKFGATLRV